jgi:hypothetical protein
MPKNETKGYEWFVEPLKDVAHANAVIARALEEEVDDAHSFCRNKLCADGKVHNLWSYSWENVMRLWSSRDSLHIAIKIWGRKDGGKIRDCTFLFRGRRRRISKTNPCRMPIVT